MSNSCRRPLDIAHICTGCELTEAGLPCARDIFKTYMRDSPGTYFLQIAQHWRALCTRNCAKTIDIHIGPIGPIGSPYAPNSPQSQLPSPRPLYGHQQHLTLRARLCAITMSVWPGNVFRGRPACTALKRLINYHNISSTPCHRINVRYTRAENREHVYICTYMHACKSHPHYAHACGLSSPAT